MHLSESHTIVITRVRDCGITMKKWNFEGDDTRCSSDISLKTMNNLEKEELPNSLTSVSLNLLFHSQSLFPFLPL